MSSWSYGGPPDPARGLRIGDAERDRAAQALGGHFAEGRLDSEEYDERAGQVWAARTLDELIPVFGDLPGGLPAELRGTEHWVAGPHRPGPAVGPAAGHGVPRRGWSTPRILLTILAVLVLTPIAVGIITGAMPVLIAGLLVWFFVFGGPSRGRQRNHHGPWQRPARW